ncbi:DUF882 domain-containing protein [Neptuniibacter caesariensis]|uniref:Murein endopeptidase K n=1 Tax=Neptuniibacter caesariensis TaxID=207954 RepID=A0A7U8C5W2_NEPCE|nr:DUF882 domain-containing protein [Neptuniibacter caesariensis]EAR62145.1 hypothetical protein MED92_10579 [Oceanospirillum sp. MED92] [Neptuniibacter caesariensis]
MSYKPDGHCPTRRKLLKAIGGISALSAISNPAIANIHKPQERSLSLLNLHTGESINSTFLAGGEYQYDSLADLNHVLRDHRTDQAMNMDKQLLLLLNELQQTFGEHNPIHVISAYRSPKTNAMLSQKNSKVAKKSYHMKGQAIDIRIPGVELKDLHKASLDLKAGGVGLYTRSNFIHLDVGRVRRWGS